jgi:PEP-CTERM motif
MNFRQCLFATAAASALVGFSAPAQAASFLGVPVVTDSSAASGIKGYAATMPFSNSVFTPTKNTTVTFSVEDLGLGSRGKLLSKVGFMSGGSFTSLLEETSAYNPGSNTSNDWLGTCGVAITTCKTSFTFQQGVNYTLGLLTGNKFTAFGVAQEGSYTFSTKSDEMKPTFTTVSAPGSYILGFEDKGYFRSNGQYWHDYQDWTIKATVEPESVPEPASLLGLSLVGGGFFFSRRKTRKSESVA